MNRFVQNWQFGLVIQNSSIRERHSRFLMLIKVPSKDTAVVVAALSKRVRKLPATLRRSLTWDRGLEMAKHKAFTVATDVQVYFCDPQSPWQRGTTSEESNFSRSRSASATIWSNSGCFIMLR